MNKKKILSMLIVVLMLTTAVAYASGVTITIEVMTNKVNVSINGETVSQANSNYILDNGDAVPNSIVYKDTTYLPIRKVAELLGQEVTWDGSTNTIGLQDIATAPVVTETENDATPIGTVLYDVDGLVITYQGIVVESRRTYILFEATNDTEYNYNIQRRNTVLNGIAGNHGSMSDDAASGMKSALDITLYNTTLENMGVDKIETFDLSFHISDDDDIFHKIDTETITIKN